MSALHAPPSLAACAERWRTIEAGDADPNPFLSYPWLSAWLATRGRGMPLHLLISEDGATIVPCVELRRGGARIWRLLGHEDSDFAGVLSSHPPEVAWDAAFSLLAARRGEWDLLHLHSVPQAALVTAAATRHLGQAGVAREYERCPMVTMGTSWDAFLAGRKKLKYEFRRWRKRLEELGEVRVTVEAPPFDAATIAKLEEVERDSWKWEHGNPAFRAGPQRDFLEAALAEGELPARLWSLHVGGKVAAASLVLVGPARWYYYLATYRSAYRNSGSLLLGHIIEGAHAAGCRDVSLLRGDHGYKDAWADGSEAVHEFVIPSGMRGRLAAAAFALRWRMARSDRIQRWRTRLLGIGDRRAAGSDAAAGDAS